MIKKPTGGLRPFDRDQLFVSIYDSCKHRPAAVSDAAYLVETILSQVVGKQQAAVIDRKDIAQTTLQILKRFDRTAATIYAAYHPLP